MTCEASGEGDEKGEGDADGTEKGNRRWASHKTNVENMHRVRRTVDKTKRTTSSDEIGQTMAKSGKAQGASHSPRPKPDRA